MEGSIPSGEANMERIKMSLRLYNSMTRKKEKFVPIDTEGKKVVIYNCGPTVYDRFHIGNARNFIFIDMVRSYLHIVHKYKVSFIQNITDIDDKIIQRVKEKNVDYEDFVEEQIDHYFKDLKNLRVRKPDQNPSVCEHPTREKIQSIIDQLIRKNMAYKGRDSVYFRTAHAKNYGELSNRKTKNEKSGARVPVEEEKEDPQDFAIWKKQKGDHEPSWRGRWGEGRPGWHIECVAMILNQAETVDIHSGGIDLVFPHHENEIAIAKEITGKPLAKYWLHNEFLRVNDKKMSKRLGNVVSIENIVKKYNIATIRYFLLATHYRKPLNYSKNYLVEAQTAVGRIHEGMDIGRKILGDNYKTLNLEKLMEIDRAKNILQDFVKTIDNDFNFSGAFRILHHLVSVLHQESGKKNPNYILLNEFYSLVDLMAYQFFRLEPDLVSDRLNEEETLDFLIETRKKARQDKNFEIADMIRDYLENRNVIIEDYPSKSIWRDRNEKSKTKHQTKLG